MYIHYDDVIMSAIASQITSLTIVYSTVYSGADQRKHESSGSQAFVRWIHRGPVNSPHKWPVTRKMFPFDDVIMFSHWLRPYSVVFVGWCRVCSGTWTRFRIEMRRIGFSLHDRDDVIKWKPFPRYCSFVRGISRSPGNSPHKCQWRGALMFSLICV